jgi:hypothetical protein
MHSSDCRVEMVHENRDIHRLRCFKRLNVGSIWAMLKPMTGVIISPDLRRFIVANIHTVPHLEALILLQARGGTWTTTEVGLRIYLDTSRAEKLLKELAASRLVSGDGDCWRYEPASTALNEMVCLLAATYTRHVVAVAELIHSRLGRNAIDFADAFILRKDPE